MRKLAKTCFKKGQSGNPKGRPPKPEIEELRRALKVVEKDQGKTFIQHFIDKAFTEKDYALALWHSLVPTRKSIEAEFGDLNINIKETFTNGS